VIPRLYHGATTILTPDRMGVGPLRPMGITVHYTGDRDVLRIRKALVDQGLGYHLIIARDGEVVQLTYLDLRVFHAGKASWNGQSPNRTHVAIAIESYGELQHEKGSGYRAWNGTLVAMDKIAIRPGNFNQTKYAWDAATTKQEASLMTVLRWFCSFGISPRNICGHDECAIPLGRKVDPGGVLSKTMVEIRKSLV
jgi:N-acetyl-anhydromuramyl-L-alanine amidase AmpD